MTVYGDGRFIGEGITEPVPPRAAVVVPFALDRQVVVEHMDNEKDRIAKLVTAQRGILTAEVQHRRSTRFTITSRLHQPTKVYLRHRLESGWALVDAPSKFTKVGDSQLFEVDLGPRRDEVRHDRRGDAGRALGSTSAPTRRSACSSVYVDEPDASPALKTQLAGAARHPQAGRRPRRQDHDAARPARRVPRSARASSTRSS